MNSKRTYDISVFFGLATTFKRTFKVVSINNQNSIVSLSCSSDHIWDEISMPRRVKKNYVSTIEINLFDSNIYGDTSGSFFLSRISDPGIFEGLFPCFFGLFFIFVNFFLADEISLFQKDSYESGFS